MEFWLDFFFSSYDYYYYFFKLFVSVSSSPFPFSSGPQLSLHLHGCFFWSPSHCCLTKSVSPSLVVTAEGDIWNWQQVSVVNKQRSFRPFPFDPSTSVTYAKYREKTNKPIFPFIAEPQAGPTRIKPRRMHHGCLASALIWKLISYLWQRKEHTCFIQHLYNRKQFLVN